MLKLLNDSINNNTAGDNKLIPDKKYADMFY